MNKATELKRNADELETKLNDNLNKMHTIKAYQTVVTTENGETLQTHDFFISSIKDLEKLLNKIN
jgi:hypothetical protein